MELELNTKYFGRVSYHENETIHFSEGLFGFEDQKDYLPISFQPDDDAMISLQSITDEHLAFVLMNPFYLLEHYNPHLQPSDLRDLGMPDEDDLSYYVICAVKEDMNQSTVNLKCPVIVNAKTRCAIQVILENSDYTFRHTLSDLTKKGA